MKHPFIYIIFLLTIVRLNAQDPLLYDPVVTSLDEGFGVAEGPTWVDNKLVFSDIYANKLYQWAEEGGTSVFLDSSGNTNGIALDNNGRLLLAQIGKRRVAVLLENNQDSMIVDNYIGKKFNSPNDIAVRADGAFYFTDPPFMTPSEDLELAFSGVYLYTNDNELKLLDSTVNFPNGIILSPDQSILYVSSSPTGEIYKYDVDEDTVNNKTIFAQIEVEAGKEWLDGMAVDVNGYLYVTGPAGIYLFHPDGTLINTIVIPQGVPTNCGWGASDDTTLYVTAWQYLYKITNKVPATFINTNIRENNKLMLLSSNPFINHLRISYTLESESNIRLAVYSATGRLIDLLVDDKMYTGEHTFLWENSDIKPGIYFIYLNTNSSFEVLKCIKLDD